MHTEEQATPQAADTKSNCPRCGSERVYRSTRRGWVERLAVLGGARLRRCHRCNLRFIRVAGSTVPVSDAQRFARKVGFLMLMLAAAAAVVALMAWLMLHQAEFSHLEATVLLIAR